MSAERRLFIDANVLLYLLSHDSAKADAAEALLRSDDARRIISTQTIGEFVSVARKKAGLDWAVIGFHVETLRMLCAVEQVAHDDQTQALAIAERFQLSWWDSQMIATAIRCGAEALVSEDLQHGQVIAGNAQSIRIENPFL
jgi:predicted nucleic acid-binding protein